MDAFEYNPTIDQAIEQALRLDDFGSIRAMLIKAGYSITDNEQEPDLIKALDLNPEMKPETATALLFLEETIRKRDVETLRSILLLNGHKISKPKFCEQPSNVLSPTFN